MSGRMQCQCWMCEMDRGTKDVHINTYANYLGYKPGSRRAAAAEAEKKDAVFLEASGIAAMNAKIGGVSGQGVAAKPPQPLTIPEGAQARLDAQVKKLEREFTYVIDGLASARDAHGVPYVVYAWGLDVWGEGNTYDYKGVTDKQCDDLIARFVDEFEQLPKEGAEDPYGEVRKRFRQVVWRRRPVFDLQIGEDGNGRLQITTRLHF